MLLPIIFAIRLKNIICHPLLLICISGMFLCYLPIFMTFRNYENAGYLSKPLHFLYTQYLRDSIVAGIAVTIPILLEIIFDKNKTKFWSQWLILMFLLVPNILIIFYIIPFGSVLEFGCLQFASSMFFFHITMYYLHELGSVVWSYRSTIFLSISYNIATIASCMKVYSSLPSYYNSLFSVLSLSFYCINFLMLIYYYYKWIRYIRKESYIRILTYEENCCNLYLIVLGVVSIGSWLISATTPNSPMNGSIFSNYCIILFAIAINANHGRLLRQQEALSQVKYLNNVLYLKPRESPSSFLSYCFVYIFNRILPQQEFELKKMFVRYISHELRTPLNTITLGLQVLKNSLGDSFIDGECMVKTLAEVTHILMLLQSFLNTIYTNSRHNESFVLDNRVNHLAILLCKY